MAMDQSDVKALRSDALGPAEIEAKAETLAVGKAGMAGAKCFVLAMLAGAFIAFGATYFLVFLAVWIGFSARTVVDKVLGIMLPISFFVAAGFEHCVANMFFLPTGLLMKSAGFGAAVANAGALDVTAILYNLSAATVGNIIGGVLVGLAYWFVYARNKAK